jgi:hypothetical protein
VILNQLQVQFHQAEPVTREFIALMGSTFRYYADTRNQFFEQLAAHLHQSELISLVNVEIKSRLFRPEFCDGLQEALKAHRRALIRLEDLRAAHGDLPATVNDLERLARLGEQVEALYQRHWEYYRYQTRLNEEEIVRLLLEVDGIAHDWDGYLTQFTAVQRLAAGLSGRAVAEGQSVLTIRYTQDGPQQFSVTTLKSLMDFLDCGYRFISAVFGIDTAAHPLTVLNVAVAEPVQLHLSLPSAAEEAYRKLLQYLFLKDMLKRDALLKFVFDAVEKAYTGTKPLTAGELTAFQKELAAVLKPLPQGARFTFADRTFPGDEIEVLNDLTASLEQAHVNVQPLLGGGDKPRKAAKAKLEEAAAGALQKLAEHKQAESRAASPKQPSLPMRGDPPDLSTAVHGPLHTSLQGKQHIHILTEKLPES